MSAVDPKDSMRFLIEFHCHTFRSYDGFTTDQQLLDACLVKGIGAVAITEHDLPCQVDVEMFKSKGISIIPSCEFTTDLGAHIIGLFIDNVLPAGNTRENVFKFILDSGGLILLPHPWKPGSGYFTFYGEDSLLNQVSLIELYNGGWNSTTHLDAILNVAKRFEIKLVGASDSHKAWQVGFYVTAYNYSNELDLKHAIKSMQPEILVDTIKKSPPRELNSLQKISLYQHLVLACPVFIKDVVKRFFYIKKSKKFVPINSNYLSIYK